MAIVRLATDRDAAPIAAIYAPVALHEAVGFTLVGVYRGIGYKLGSWHDVAWYEAEIQSESASPSPPEPVSALFDSVGWRDAAARGLAHYVQQ